MSKLPELPPRFRWNKKSSKGALELEAYETKWVGKNEWESLAYMHKPGDIYKARIWKLKSEGVGSWEHAGSAESLEQGAQYIWSLVQLGEADFTFLEETCEPTTRD